MSPCCPPAFPLTFLATVVAACLSGRAAGGEPDGPAHVDPGLGPGFEAAVDDAARRLDERPCALVLSDFLDSRTGRTLAENLARTGRTASEHVRSLWFSGSSGLRRLSGRRVYAFTRPSSPVVYLCRDELGRLRTQRRLVSAIVIHEVLHTLGLAEDAPSSVEVTARVRARCG